MDFERDYAFGQDAKGTRCSSGRAAAATFNGIVRADGRVATRNYLGIVTSVNCSATVARMIAGQFQEGSELAAMFPNLDGVVALTHGSGCGMAGSGEGFDLLRRTLSGYAMHPNFAGLLVLGLGCEVNQVRSLTEGFDLPSTTPFLSMTIQEMGGTRATVREATARMRELAEEANQAERTPVPASELVLGLECGGSDGYSGITANPALGVAADLLVQHGGTAVLGETPEIYGAEHLLTRRAASREVGERLVERIHWWEDYVKRCGASLDNNPSPGNKEGGLTTILEKSLGAVAKGGSQDLTAVYEYAEPHHGQGLRLHGHAGVRPGIGYGDGGGRRKDCVRKGASGGAARREPASGAYAPHEGCATPGHARGLTPRIAVRRSAPAWPRLVVGVDGVRFEHRPVDADSLHRSSLAGAHLDRAAGAPADGAGHVFLERELTGQRE